MITCMSRGRREVVFSTRLLASKASSRKSSINAHPSRAQPSAAPSFSTLTDAQRLTGVRLYRVLMRQCRLLERDLRLQWGPAQQEILLQLPVNPHHDGSSSIFLTQARYATDDNIAGKRKIWNKFYHWNSVLYDFDPTDPEEDFLDEWALQVKKLGVVSDGDDEYYDEDGDDDHGQLDGSSGLWTNMNVLKEAIRMAFRHDFSDVAVVDDLSPEESSSALWIRYQHQWAIRAYQILCEQQELLRRSSTSLEHNVKVTAVSKCIGREFTRNPRQLRRQQQQQHWSSSTAQDDEEQSSYYDREVKYRFAYRIRIENVSPTETIQLLGRTWNIQEFQNEEETDNDRIPVGEPIRVHEPQTGAVGQLPVLQPGQSFEYISAAALGGPGEMKGCFHLATVPANTPSAIVGMAVPAFADHETRFEVTVQPFPLMVEPATRFLHNY